MIDIWCIAQCTGGILFFHMMQFDAISQNIQPDSSTRAMAIRVVEFSNGGYKCKTYSKEIIEF
jgi:hypothetical protein